MRQWTSLKPYFKNPSRQLKEHGNKQNAEFKNLSDIFNITFPSTEQQPPNTTTATVLRVVQENTYQSPNAEPLP